MKSSLTNEVITNEVITVEVITNEVITNEGITNEGSTNEVITDEVITDEVNEVIVTDSPSPAIGDSLIKSSLSKARRRRRLRLRCRVAIVAGAATPRATGPAMCAPMRVLRPASVRTASARLLFTH
jgi:hypothetical protein